MTATTPLYLLATLIVIGTPPLVAAEDNMLGLPTPQNAQRRGTVVLGAVAGDPHAIPSAVVADLLRGARFDADDLGANVPPPSFVAAAQAADRLRGVAIVATVQSAADGVAATIAALREAGVDAPMVVGGAGVTAAVARAAGADLFTGTAADVVAAFEVSTH